ncbi:MAG TPA: nucleoside triphosphate pyrophosphohydrolase [Blastocatellia bacterium]|nr:nucleoside triphosphate pyrophosphohydrolase [Blastocatellia bacterium]
MNDADRNQAAEAFRELALVVDRLRSPGGCPWDLEQTHDSLKPMMIEEAYEAVQAIEDGDEQELIGELGDLLLQVLFHSRIANEEGRFTVADVIRRVSEKMVRRHPHVFGEEKAETASDVLRSWEAIKATEVAQKRKGQPSESMLDSVSKSLPAVMEAFQMTTKVSRVGFDWPDASPVMDKLDEEVAELKQAVGATDPEHNEISGEIGDILFVLVNVARKLGIDPEAALKSSNRKFRRRFKYIEDRLNERGTKPANSTLEEMDALWDECKQIEKLAK